MTGNLTWNANGTLRTLAITDGFNSGGTQTCTYGYDDLVRIASVDCKNSLQVSIWTQSFGLGANGFGNLTKTGSNGGMTFAATYNNSTNRISSAGGQPYTYDTNGNILSTGTGVGSTSYTWDAEGKMLSTTPYGSSVMSFTYNALGQQVGRNVSGTVNQFVWAGGQILARMAG